MNAKAKLEAEMNANLNDQYIQVIGGFLLQHLDMNPAAAEKLLAKDKTIAKSLDAMKSEARKKQKNGMAMLTDAEGFAVVLKYFGIEGAPAFPVAPAVQPAAPAPAAAATDFDVKLEDFGL